MIEFSDSENEAMLRLPRKEYVVTSTKAELLGLVDIVFAWAYDHRTTLGDHTVESAWTITTLSATLAYLIRHANVRAALTTAVRRALAYPLYRNWEVIQQVLSDTKHIFALGKRAVLKCLLDCREVLMHDEVRHCLVDLYLTDYCVWIQSVPDKAFAALTTRVQRIDVMKDDVGWPLEQIEAIVDNDDDAECTESDPANTSGTDSDDNSSDSDSDANSDDVDDATDANVQSAAPVASITASLASLTTDDSGHPSNSCTRAHENSTAHDREILSSVMPEHLQECTTIAPGNVASRASEWRAGGTLEAADENSDDEEEREIRRYIASSHSAITARWGACACCPPPAEGTDAASGSLDSGDPCLQNRIGHGGGVSCIGRDMCISPSQATDPRKTVGIEVLSSTEFCPSGNMHATDPGQASSTTADAIVPHADCNDADGRDAVDNARGARADNRVDTASYIVAETCAGGSGGDGHTQHDANAIGRPTFHGV